MMGGRIGQVSESMRRALVGMTGVTPQTITSCAAHAQGMLSCSISDSAGAA